ncbi:MAG: YbhB/YbcL family Raf kinase inhibitor-like protein [Frankiaceae bacterium]
MADTITVTSDLFREGGTIPVRAAHSSVGGQNESPHLAWTGVPDGTASIAVTCYDPDAPTTIGFVHWVLFNLDPSTTELPPGAGAAGANPPGSVHGFVDYGSSEYGGMAPPPDDPPHRYEFRVFALDQLIDADETTTYAKLRFMMRGHVLAEGSLTGRFGLGDRPGG